MAVRIVRLGSERKADEGTRIGTVRRPPRGVPKAEHASADWYDVWLPLLSPSPDTVALGRAATTERELAAFARRYRREMAAPAPRQTIALLARLSTQSSFSVGCYCADERRCHRSILRDLLAAHGASIVEG